LQILQELFGTFDILDVIKEELILQL